MEVEVRLLKWMVVKLYPKRLATLLAMTGYQNRFFTFDLAFCMGSAPKISSGTLSSWLMTIVPSFFNEKSTSIE